MFRGKKSSSEKPGTDPFSIAAALGRVEKTVQNMANRTDFAEVIYPNQSAMAASHQVSNILERIDANQLSLDEITTLKKRWIDPDFMSNMENGILPRTRDNATKQRKQEKKVVEIVSKDTGVSVREINRATSFWLDSLFD
jgi:hypothetical protein